MLSAVEARYAPFDCAQGACFKTKTEYPDAFSNSWQENMNTENDVPDRKSNVGVSSNRDTIIKGDVVGRDKIEIHNNTSITINQHEKNKLQPRNPFPQDDYTIIDVASIFDFSIEDIERYMGEAIISPRRGIGTSEELPDGGETRTYNHGPYMIDINYDKTGKAKGILIREGLLEQAFTLEHWPLVLSKLGMTILGQPEVVAPAAHLWKNYRGYGIQVRSAGNRSSNIESVRVFKLPA